MFPNSFLYKISCPTFQSGCPVAHSHTVPRSTVQPYGSPRSHGSTVNRPTVQPYGSPRSHGSTVNRPAVQPYGCPRSHGSTVNRPTVRSPTVTRFHGQQSDRTVAHGHTVPWSTVQPYVHLRSHGSTVTRLTVKPSLTVTWPCDRATVANRDRATVTRSRSKLAQRRASAFLGRSVENSGLVCKRTFCISMEYVEHASVPLPDAQKQAASKDQNVVLDLLKNPGQFIKWLWVKTPVPRWTPKKPL